MIPCSFKSIVIVLACVFFLKNEDTLSQEIKLANKPVPYKKVEKNVNNKRTNRVLAYHHFDFITTIGNDKYYKLKIKILNLNCIDVVYDIICFNSFGKSTLLYKQEKISEMNVNEHIIRIDQIKSLKARYILIRYNNINEEISKIPVKPMQIQTVHTHKQFGPIVKNIPEKLMFDCYNKN